MKDTLFSLIIINTVTKNIAGCEMCALSAAVASQLKNNAREDFIEIYIVGRGVYNDALKKQIELMISVNSDIRLLNLKISQNKTPKTSIECIEYLIKNIDLASVAKTCLICLGREFIKMQLIWYFERKKTCNEKEHPNITILTTLNKASTKNRFLEFIEIVKVMFYFFIRLNVVKRYCKNNTVSEKEDLNTEEEAKLETIIKTHKNT